MCHKNWLNDRFVLQKYQKNQIMLAVLFGGKLLKSMLVTINYGKNSLVMASAQVVETSVNTNNSPSQDLTTNPDDHSNHNTEKILPAQFVKAYCRGWGGGGGRYNRSNMFDSVYIS